MNVSVRYDKKELFQFDKLFKPENSFFLLEITKQTLSWSAVAHPINLEIPVIVRSLKLNTLSLVSTLMRDCSSVV